MTTANSTLRRELEEARQRAGDAEQRAARWENEYGAAKRENAEARAKLESLTAVCSDGSVMRSDIAYDRGYESGRRDILHERDSTKRLAEERLTLLHEIQDRCESVANERDEARGIVKDHVDAIDQPLDVLASAIEAARAKLREWGMT